MLGDSLLLLFYSKMFASIFMGDRRRSLSVLLSYYISSTEVTQKLSFLFCVLGWLMKFCDSLVFKVFLASLGDFCVCRF